MTVDAAGGREGRRASALCLIAIFVVALGIRFVGIGWGLKNGLHNQSYHPDEPWIFDFVNRTILFHPAEQRQYYNYGTLYYAILRFFGWFGSIFGVRPPANMNASAFADPAAWDQLNAYVSQFDLWGRVASALAGAGTAALMFAILRRRSTTLGAIAGGALIAFAPAHIEHSRFQTVDVISLFFVALATWACLRLLDEDLMWRDFLVRTALAAILVGFAASTRYSNAIALLPVLAALVIQRPKNWPGLAVLAVALAGIAFVFTTPGCVTDTAYFLENLSFQSEHASAGHGLVFVSTPSGYVMHIEHLMTGISAIAAILGLAGLLYAAYRRHKWAWIALAFFIPYYISIGGLEVKFLRYGFPLYVGVALGFGYAISAVQRRSGSALLAGGLALIAMVGLESPQSGLRGAYAFTSWMTGTDPRDEAAEYLRHLGSRTEVGLLDKPWFWSPAVVRDAEFVRFQPDDFVNGYLAQTSNPKVVLLTSGAVPEYVAYSSYESDDLSRLKGRSDIPIEFMGDVAKGESLFDALKAQYETIAVFGAGGPKVHDLQYVRPAIYVLKRRS